MKVDFEIEENRSIRSNEILIDFHNNFYFIDCIEIKKLNSDHIQLEFKKSDGESAHKYEYLTFKFKNVSYRYFEDGKSGNFPGSLKLLKKITYFPKEFRNSHDKAIPQSTPGEDDDIIFSFEDGGIIRLNSEYIELEVKK